MKANQFSLITLTVLLFCTTTAVSQNSVIDSLRIELQNHKKKDTTRVNLLNDLAYLYHKKDTDKALVHLEESETIAGRIDFTKGIAKSLFIRGALEAVESNYSQGFQNYIKALELYKTIDFKEGMAECYKEMGGFMYYKGDQENAIKYYTKSLKILNEHGKKKEIALILHEIGWSYIRIDNYTEARSYILKALKINEEIGNDEGLSSCMNGIATTYSNQGNYPVALDYFNQALAVAKKNSNTRRIILTLGNMGVLYFYLKKYNKAIELYKEALKLTKSTDKEIISKNFNNLGLAYKEKKENELAYEYLKKAQTFFNELNDRPGEAFALNNIGDIYLQEKDYRAAYENYEKAKKICIEIENQRGLCVSYLGLAKVYVHQQNYDEALINALKSKKLSVKYVFLEYQREAQELLSKIYKNTNNFKNAFESHQEFKKLNDSIFNKKNIEKLAQLEYEYKYKRALDSASIRALQLTKTVTATNLDLEKSQRNYLWAIIGVLLISILLSSIIFYQKFKNIKTKNENIIIEQKLLRSQMTPHFIFNSLSVLQGMILNKEEKKSVSYLSKFSKLLRIVLENSRDKVVPLIQELDAIDNYMVLQNLDTDSPYNYSLVVDENININLFQIPPMLIQPFIENTIEHAFTADKKNREIEIHLKFANEKLICTIADNGKGIDAITKKTNTNKKSLATTITNERLQLLSKEFKVPGDITIEDRNKYNKQGTLVTLTIPYKINGNS